MLDVNTLDSAGKYCFADEKALFKSFVALAEKVGLLEHTDPHGGARSWWLIQA